MRTAYFLLQKRPGEGHPRWHSLLGILAGLAGLAGLIIVAVIAAGVAFSHLQNAQASQSSINPVVGAWDVLARGAPFPPHVMEFHQDGTLEIDNPESGDSHTSDSAGYGAWRTDPHQANRIEGQFEEVNADRATGKLASYLIVTFSLIVTGNTFSSPTAAEATYYDASWQKMAGPYPAMLSGTRIQA